MKLIAWYDRFAYPARRISFETAAILSKLWPQGHRGEMDAILTSSRSLDTSLMYIETISKFIKFQSNRSLRQEKYKLRLFNQI